MARIPKKVSERFSKNVGKYQRVLNVASDRDVNESDTVAIITDILADVFGYDKYIEITREFAIRSTYCDLAIKIDDKVQFLIEVKAIGIKLRSNHLRQALDYGANHGIKWVILTNGLEWQVHRIRFEQPIDHDMVCDFKFDEINPRSDKDHESLFLIAREGLSKKAREDYFEKVQSVNRFVVSALLQTAPVVSLVRRELRKLAEGARVDEEEILEILRQEVLKREVVEGEEAVEACNKVCKFFKKAGKKSSRKTKVVAPPAEKEMSISDRLLAESEGDGE